MGPIEKRRIHQKINKTDLLFVLFFAVIFSLSLFFVRPMQDDYVALRDVSSVGLQESIYGMWKYWGGNISTIAISNLFISLYFQGHLFFGIALHSIFTVLLILSAFRILMRFFLELTNVEVKITTSTWLFLSFMCLGSLHAPGYISVLNFTLAATAHLWPTIIFVHAIYFARFGKKVTLPLLLLVGFLIGNFNVSESIFCLATTLAILVFRKSTVIYFLRIRTVNLMVLLVGQIIGFLTIVFAPGFRVRSEIVISPNSVQELVFNFFKALIYNLGDIVLHPGWLLGLLFGFTIKTTFISREGLFRYLKLNSFALLTCLLTVSAGGAFAYPSWYHTMSFYVFVFPIFFTVGLIMRDLYGLPFRKKFTVLKHLFFFLCVFLLIRDITMIGMRAEHWDRNFAINRIKVSFNQYDLVGYDINYWPLGLGVDDVEKWDWINSAYVGWLQNTQSKP